MRSSSLFLGLAMISAAALAAQVDFKDPRRAVGRENDIRVDAVLADDAVSSAFPIGVTYQIENLTPDTIAVADKVTDSEYDSESQTITLSIGAEVPTGPFMPHLVTIKPGQKREFAYGYGQGLVPSPESAGQVEMALGGSFAPGKLFTVTAYVHDPAEGQSLGLVLPEGMTLVDGPDVQPVPAAREGGATSLVFWRARVQRPGEFAVRIRSSMGVTHGKLVTVTQP